MTHPTALMCDSFITLRTVSETFSRSQAGTSFNITASVTISRLIVSSFYQILSLGQGGGHDGVSNVRSADHNDSNGVKT